MKRRLGLAVLALMAPPLVRCAALAGVVTAGKLCEVEEECQLCGAHEMEASYCQPTRRKQQYRCTMQEDESQAGVANPVPDPDPEDAEETAGVSDAFPVMEDSSMGPVQAVQLRDVLVWRSCDQTKADGFHAFLFAEVGCITLGIMALVGVSRRKRQNMNLFDRLQRDRNSGASSNGTGGKVDGWRSWFRPKRSNSMGRNGPSGENSMPNSPSPTTRRMRGSLSAGKLESKQ